MKFDVTYQIEFEVTRTVDIDEDDLEEFARRHNHTSLGGAAEQWLRWQDTDSMAEVFDDWRSDKPLPDDFELQCVDVDYARLHTDG